MGYSGSFKTSASGNGSASVNHPSRLNWGTGVDPSHSDPTWGKDQGFPALTNPPVPEVPGNIADTRVYEEGQYTESYEHEPSGHDGYRGHDVNLGATLKNTATMVMRSVTQTFSSARLQSLAPSPGESGGTYSGQALRALRGRNSLVPNNPGASDVNFSGDYIRSGYEITRVTDRRMPNRTLKHTKRAIHLNLATTARETKGPQGVDYSPYSSPFTSVSTQNIGTARPMQRREPRPWDESIIDDGSEYSYEEDWAQMNSWGL